MRRWMFTVPMLGVLTAALLSGWFGRPAAGAGEFRITTGLYPDLSIVIGYDDETGDPYEMADDDPNWEIPEDSDYQEITIYDEESNPMLTVATYIKPATYDYTPIHGMTFADIFGYPNLPGETQRVERWGNLNLKVICLWVFNSPCSGLVTITKFTYNENGVRTGQSSVIRAIPPP